MNLNKVTIIFATLLVIIVAVTVLYKPPYFHNEFAEAPVSIDSCNDSNITGIVYSLNNYPRNWKSTNYELRHIRGVTVWIANEDYGLEIKIDEETSGYAMTDECRAILYTATSNWTKNYINAHMRGKNGV